MSLSLYERDPRLFLFTSLTAGSSHIVTATSRMETILKANKIPFQAIDTATDEMARKLWQRRSQGRKLPGLVKEGWVVCDLEQCEEWNEFGELHENLSPPTTGKTAAPTAPADGPVGVNIAPPLTVNPTATAGTTKLSTPGLAPKAVAGNVTIAGSAGRGGGRGAAGEKGSEEAPRLLPAAEEMKARIEREKEEKKLRAEAEKAKASGEGDAAGTSVLDAGPPKVETMRSAGEEKMESIAVAAGEKEKGKTEGSTAAATTGEEEKGGETAVEDVSADSGSEEEEEEEEKKKEEETPATQIQQHRGSEVKEAPEEEVKKVESQTALAEESEEEESEEEAESKAEPKAEPKAESKAESKAEDKAPAKPSANPNAAVKSDKPATGSGTSTDQDVSSTAPSVSGLQIDEKAGVQG